MPKPFTPFQWFGQVNPQEMTRRHQILKDALRRENLRNVVLKVTNPQITLLEAAICRGNRESGALIHQAWLNGAKFDAWDDKFQILHWHNAAQTLGMSLEDLGCRDRAIGLDQPWDVIHAGLTSQWLVKEWQNAVSQLTTSPCTENSCHACGVCRELNQTHCLAAPNVEATKNNPFLKRLDDKNTKDDGDSSRWFMKPRKSQSDNVVTSFRFTFTKCGDLRFISHLDLQQLLIRATRRAALNVAYTNGMNPSPKLNLAAPLPLFQESLAEVGEIDLSESLSADELVQALNRKLPEEVRLLTARVLDGKNDSLACLLGSASYKAVCPAEDIAGPISAQLETRINEVLSYHPDSVADDTGKRNIVAGIISLIFHNQPAPTLFLKLRMAQKCMSNRPKSSASFNR